MVEVTSSMSRRSPVVLTDIRIEWQKKVKMDVDVYLNAPEMHIPEHTKQNYIYCLEFIREKIDEELERLGVDKR